MKRLPVAVRDTNGPAQSCVVDPGFDAFRKAKKREPFFRGLLKASDEARRRVSAMSPVQKARLAARARTYVAPSVPTWFHPLGFDVKVERLNVASLSLALSNQQGAAVSITWVMPVHYEDPQDRVWEVTYHLCDREETVSVDWRGLFTPIQLTVAFTLEYDQGSSPRLFVRKGRFLSLPTEGTRARGNPTVFVYLSDEIMEAVLSLMQNAR